MIESTFTVPEIRQNFSLLCRGSTESNFLIRQSVFYILHPKKRARIELIKSVRIEAFFVFSVRQHQLTNLKKRPNDQLLIKAGLIENAFRNRIEDLLGHSNWYRRYRNAAVLTLAETVAEIIRKDNLECFITGGIAYDALRGKLTRLHHDVDIVFLARHRPVVLSAFRRQGFRFEERSPYHIGAHADNGLRVDLLAWAETAAGTAEMISEGVLVRVPRFFFSISQTAYLENVCLRLPGNELLKSIIPFVNTAQDRLFLSELDTNFLIQSNERMETVLRRITIKVCEQSIPTED